MFSPQTKEVTEKFFPDVEVEINTPAFHKKKGFTTYKEMMNFLQPLVDQHPEEVQLLADSLDEMISGNMDRQRVTVPSTEVW